MASSAPAAASSIPSASHGVFTSVTSYQNEKVERSLCLQKTAYGDQARPWEGGSLGWALALGLVPTGATCLGLLLVHWWAKSSLGGVKCDQLPLLLMGIS